MKLRVVILFLLVFVSAVVAHAQQDQTSKYLDKALQFIEKKEFETALVMCTYAVKSDSASCEAFYTRALCFNKMGNQAAALRDVDHALSLNSRLPEAYLLRSRVNQSLGNIRQSVADLNKARSLDPVGTTVHLARRFFRSILP
ncbi:MAG: hypothetical protein PHU33_14825 [Bacteroidales bacterium]|jgi:Tfp pilus assembly protein PilF|nr:hypothetical protein [Bacteroidales bacterium]